MTKLEIYQSLVDENAKAQQSLSRTPEPDAVTDSEGSVMDYDTMMNSNMTANYAVCLDLILRGRSSEKAGHAFDLCCGPGLFSISLINQLKYKKVDGVDLSPGMIEAAAKNAKGQQLKAQAEFSCADILQALKKATAQKYDLVCMTNAAHHLPNLKTIGSVLKEAERVTRADGLIFVSDLARLKSERITEKFVTFAGADYGEHMKVDFANSMRAAWLPEELIEAVPVDSSRTWCSVALGGLPFFQALVGLPVGMDKLKEDSGVDWLGREFFPNEAAIQDWHFMSASIKTGLAKYIKPGRTFRVAG